MLEQHNVEIVSSRSIRSVPLDLLDKVLEKIKLAVMKILDHLRLGKVIGHKDGVILEQSDSRYRVMVRTKFKYNSKFGGVLFKATIYLRNCARRARRLLPVRIVYANVVLKKPLIYPLHALALN